MSSNSPTCILSSAPCIQEPQGVSTISSEVESNPAFFCEKCLYLQDQNTTPVGSHNRCCLVTGILPAITRSHDGDNGESCRAESQRSQPNSNPSSLPSKSTKSNKTCGWKTSKFFSKTMSSGEILRGLKKLSLTSSGSSSDPGEPEPGKPRKSKSGQLKKRSSCGNDDVGSVEDDNKARSPRSPGGFRPLSKTMSLSEPGTTKTSNLGIVCKKEDLKAILCTATNKKFPLASPTKRRRGQTPLRQTKSASFDPPEDKQRKKDPIRRAGSEESRTKRSHQSFDNNEVQPQNENVPQQTKSQMTSNVLVVDNLNAQNNHLNSMLTVDEQPSCLPERLSEGSLSAVKWDECEVVDAVIIGDAIESFLKGSMSGSEKKVSFRRNSDKKAKSDG
ncbi:hypothetical protein X975_07393, partial [Stegodyphus mimosarum]